MSKNKILLSIIVPLYNEENTILKVLKKLSKLKETYDNIQIIVINDGSKDNSQIILDNNSWFYDELIINSTNQGKGNAVKKGLALAKGQYITFQDADLEYDPIEFIKFIKLINNFSPDLIIGSRLNFADYSRSHNIFNKYGNQFITFIFNILYNTTFTDIYSCYACFKKNLLDNEIIKTNGFEQHAEILCKVVKNGKIFYEVPINYNGRSHEEGKKIKFYHIFSVIYQILVGRIT
jgi:glycosyltransferase involved in cell wall biosynthesis|tara:strand:- start:3627 stop:4331 length:705 start_codon:yes stop_codon:yes gene_type:complete